MKKNYAFLIFLLIAAQTIFAQHPTKISRATIFLDGKPINQLARLGLECDHGDLTPGVSLTSDFSETELDLARAAGFRTQILIDDVVHFYQNQNQHFDLNDRSGGNDCKTNWPTPDHFTFGSMGGFYTMDETYAILQQMHDLYPNLITVKKTVSDTVKTHEGRSIYFVKISDNASTDEPTEPQVCYTALHHAREPEGLSQLIFFMWHLLENYDSDPEIKQLVDNLELYFVPIVNPDGYEFNRSTDPNGGGYWRKNRRNNGDGTMGVDLNRNYGYEWGYDDNGSSPQSGSEVYRGPSPFSEPETRAIRDFCNAHSFKLALNYHTYGNLLIHPWGYADTPSNDQPIFARIIKWLRKENNYKAGLASQTVGYQVNGVSDDWFYGENGTKPAIFSLTPEVGPSFWPSMGEIIPLAQGTMWQNLTLARFALNAAYYTDYSETYLPNALNGNLLFDLNFLGIEPTNFTVSIKGLTANVTSVGAAKNIPMGAVEVVPGSFAYSLDPTIQQGDPVLFEITIDNGSFLQRDTLRKFFGGKLKTQFTDPLGSAFNWQLSNKWGLTFESYHSAPTSMTDSPNDYYEQSSMSAILMKNGVQLPANSAEARLRFWTKFDINKSFDYAVAKANDTPLCGKYTTAGNAYQLFGEPIFTSSQTDWVEETMDLTSFIGSSVQISFEMVGGDFGGFQDGFYFDDVKIEITEPDGSVRTVNLDESDFKITSQPNPAVFETTLFFEKQIGEANLLIFNSLGQKTNKINLTDFDQTSLRLDLSNWPSGVYFYQIQNASGQSKLQKLVVAH